MAIKTNKTFLTDHLKTIFINYDAAFLVELIWNPGWQKHFQDSLRLTDDSRRVPPPPPSLADYNTNGTRTASGLGL